MNWGFWICTKCGAPMERTMRSRDYWMCRFCGHEMDGWYPDKGAQKIPVARGEAAEYRGFRIAKVERGSEGKQKWEAILVIAISPTKEAAALRPSGTKHVFDSREVRDVLKGD